MSTMSDEAQRIRSYLRAQAAKLEPAAIVDKVRAAMQELRAAAAAVPPGRFAERPGPAEWSANEVLAHVVDAGRYFGGGIVAVLDEAPLPPSGGGGTPADAPGRRAEEWWALFARERDALFERVDRADPSAHLDRTIEHGMFGPLNWRETLLFLRLHDLDHAGQLRKIAEALA